MTARAQGYDALQDVALVALVTEGDGSALESLYGRYGRPAYALARRVLADEQLAQDVVQEVFLTVWRDATRFDARRGGFAGWLLTMTHHKAVDAVRREENLRRRRAPADAPELTGSGGPEVDDEAWGGIRRERVRAALADLPDAEREALGLAYFGGYTQREVAKLTDTPLPTVKTRMLAGAERLRGALQGPLDRNDAPGRHEPTAGHAAWEELAAGHALDALEPEDEQAFLAHRRGCDRCAADLAALRDVTGELAYAAEAAEPPAGLGRRIMAGAAAERPAAFAPPSSTRGTPLRRRVGLPGLAPLAAAAAVLLVVALGAWNLTLRAENDATTAAIARRNAALACLAAPDAPKARLASANAVRGTACIGGDRAYLVVDRLPRNDAAREIYVLWWQDGADGLHPVQGFDVVDDGPSVFALPLAVAPGDVRGMTVSLEPGRTVPARPTNPVASGAVGTA